MNIFHILKQPSKELNVIAIFVVLKMAILTVANINAGFDCDEVMHIDSGYHLAWGYLSFQPVIGLLAAIQNLFHSNSTFANHLFVMIAAALIMVYSGLLTIKLGGSWKAVLLTLTSILVAPGFGLTNHSFMPLVFEQLFWVLSFSIFVSYCQEQKAKHLYYLAILLAIGFLIKVSILFLLFGIGISILIFKREILGKRTTWYAVFIFLLLILPNLYWQYRHDFPSYMQISALYKTSMHQMNFTGNLKMLFISLNPLTSIVWLSGLLLFPFLSFSKPFRMAAVAMCCSFIVLLIMKGQFHYFYPAILLAFCAGSVLLEHYLNRKRIIFFAYLSILFISGIFIIPYGLPILPFDAYRHYMHLDKAETHQHFFTQQSITDNKTKNSDKRTPVNFEAYYTKADWEKLSASINRIYQQLPDNEKQTCLIWTNCYLHAGGINLYGKKYHLPTAFTYHASYYEWIPNFKKGITIIAVTNAVSLSDSVNAGKVFAPAFEKLAWKESIFCRYARDKYNAYYMIYLGNGLKFNSDTLKLKYKNRIYQ